MENIPVKFDAITDKNIYQLNKINDQSFPITYSEQFYMAVVHMHSKLSRFALIGDINVGSITAREEMSGDRNTAYIMTCGVLTAYRNAKIGSQLMENLFENVKKDGNIKAIRLHVWVTNTEAIKFYKKFGFQEIETVENYYQNIDPPHGLLLEKNMEEE